jgi:ankyrin repeat protein
MGDLSKDKIFQFLNTLNSTQISVHVSDQIITENPDSVRMIKYASMLGADMEMLLSAGIRANNLQCVCACIKNGSNILHEDEDGETFIHVSTRENNHVMLKYFIVKGLDVNKKNSHQLMASEIALIMNYRKCYKLLIENGAQTYHVTKGRKIYDIEVLMESYESSDPEYLELVNLVIEKTDSMMRFDSDTYDILRRCIIKRHKIVETFLLRFPKYVNATIDNITLLLLLIEVNEFESVEKIIKLKTTNLNPPDLNTSYLSYCLFYGTINEKNNEIIKYLMKKAPKLIDKKSMDGRTCVDHVLLGYKSYTTESCIQMIKLLMEKSKRGKDILNNRNSMGFRTIETAIQFTNSDVINFLIDNGINFNEEMIEEYDHGSQIGNNDPLSFACQINRPEIIETLLSRGITVNTYNQIPIALLSAISHNHHQAVNVLMSDPKIRQICNDRTIVQRLRDYCLNNTLDRNIMKHFIDDNQLDSLQINQDTVIYNKLERFFENSIDDYQENKEYVVYVLYVVITYYKLITSNGLKFTMNDVIPRYMDAKIFMGLNSCIYEYCISSICLDHICTNKFKKFNDYVEAILYTDDPAVTVDFWNRCLTTIKDLENLEEINEKLTVIHSVLKTKTKRNVKYSSEEISEYSLHSEDDTDYIGRVLGPLEKPLKVQHYDLMFQRLSGLNCTISQTQDHIVCRDNESGITAIIFNDGSYVPKRWFKHYQHNIGREKKDDYLHLFPFVLDKKLKDVNCYQKTVNDEKNQYGHILLVSFLGVLVHEDSETLGTYEYFIDSEGSLFHRFFKPWDQLSDKMKSHLSVETQRQVNQKYKVARELIKQF